MLRMVIQHDTPKLAAAMLRAAAQLPAHLDRALGRGAIEVADEVRRTAPKFRSEMTNATGTERVSAFEHHVVIAKKHALYVEDGTKPGGRPPLQEMLDWIRLKNITPRTPGMSVNSLAHLLRRRIAQNGIKAQPFAGPALEAKAGRIQMLVREAANRALREVAT